MNNIRYIDLFAGIGGIRLGFDHAAAECGIDATCVFTSEIDAHACKTYRKNFPNDDHDPENDITLPATKKAIPAFDVLLAGFPCQAFSIAGRRGGFEDTRGTLFFDIASIIKKHKPKAFILENVKGLRNHSGGKTLETILDVLRSDLGYTVSNPQILNSKEFGVPQNRERIYIVGFKNKKVSFNYPEATDDSKRIKDILEKDSVGVRYYLSDTYLNGLKNHKTRHESKGNGFGYEIKGPEGIANAVVIGGMGKERNLIVDDRLIDRTPETNIKGSVNKENVRKMTPLEWERLQGFPDGWTDSVANVHRYKQLGNAVTVPVIKALAAEVIKTMQNK